MIEEMRVETSNFDAAQGHGTGSTIAMMTRAGSNTLRGTANYQYLDEQDQLAEPAAEAGVRAAPRDREDLRGRLRELHRDHAGRSGGHPESRRRPQQAVLLRQLPAQLRQRAGPEHADEHGAGQREASQRRLLRPARAAERQPVSDLRSADRAAGSGAPRQLHPHAVPEQHHPAGSVHERERDLQEPAVRRCTGTWRRRRTRTSSRAGQVPTQQLLPGRHSQPGHGAELRRPRRLQPLGRPTASSSAPPARRSTSTTPTGPTRPSTRGCTRTTRRARRGRTPATGPRCAARRSSTPRCRPTASTRTSSGAGCTSTSRPTSACPAIWTTSARPSSNCMLPTINVDGYQGVSTGADGGLDTTNLQAQSSVTTVKGRTRCAAASTTGWRCAGPG